MVQEALDAYFSEVEHAPAGDVRASTKASNAGLGFTSLRRLQPST